jgi:tetratricopeptide (TPR) repeat protein/TolB-like protein
VSAGRVAALSFLAVIASWRLGVCQCPDGTPPPCRQVAAPARRALPPLDERTWIVLPFENLARAADLEWLRDASVNLLYLDMSKWRDIRVIDDERVADLMRDVSAAQRERLGLESGLSEARRAGAGKLVMGDLVKLGTRTRLVAKVFDVRSGQRLRSVQEDAANPDSLMSVFGRLARGILNLGSGEGPDLGAAGTSRLDAYQEYVTGVQALNAFNTTEARRRFERAIQLDSTFALAHYKLSIVLGWIAPGERERRSHAEAAARLSSSLPARERALIAAQAQAAAGDYGRSCETLTPLVGADSNDVEALYNLGECNYHDGGVVPVPGDSTRHVFRASWNTALRLFRRVLALDPTYHLAFQHIQDALQASGRQGCLITGGRVDCGADGSRVFLAVMRRHGDSLLTVPLRQAGPGAAAYAEQRAEAARDGSRRRNLEEARRAAEEWVQAGPAEPRARMTLARALLRLGRIEEAAAAARQVTGSGMSRNEGAQFAMDRFEIAIKTGNVAQASRLLDSLRAAADSVDEGQVVIGLASAMLGRPGRFDSIIRRFVPAPPPVVNYFVSATHALLGIPDDSLVPREQAFLTMMSQSPGGGDRALTLMTASLAYALRSRGPSQWPDLDTAQADPRLSMVASLARGDSARFRRVLLAYDSTLQANRDEPDGGGAVAAAEAFLVIGDTARALTRLRTFRDVSSRVTPMGEAVAQGFTVAGLLWPRTFLLLGDLAAAQGQRAEAAEAYRRFLGMWEHGESVVQPMVARARQALAALGQ